MSSCYIQVQRGRKALSCGPQVAEGPQETLQLKPWPKAACTGIWMEISNCVDLHGAYFSTELCR